MSAIENCPSVGPGLYIFIRAHANGGGIAQFISPANAKRPSTTTLYVRTFSSEIRQTAPSKTAISICNAVNDFPRSFLHAADSSARAPRGNGSRLSNYCHNLIIPRGPFAPTTRKHIYYNIIYILRSGGPFFFLSYSSFPLSPLSLSRLYYTIYYILCSGRYGRETMVENRWRARCILPIHITFFPFVVAAYTYLYSKG